MVVNNNIIVITILLLLCRLYYAENITNNNNILSSLLLNTPNISNNTNHILINDFVNIFGYGEIKSVTDRYNPLHSDLIYPTSEEMPLLRMKALRNGHRYCTLYRNNWQCKGEKYSNILNNTVPFNNTKYSLDSIHNNSFILAKGRSDFNELITILLCESENFVLYKLGNYTINTIIGINAALNITILLLDSHNRGITSESVVHNFNILNIVPNLIVIGDVMNINSNNGSAALKLQQPYYSKYYPDCKFIVLHEKRIQQCGCQADQFECGVGCGRHQCVPGPIARDAERLANRIIHHSYRIYNASYYRSNVDDSVDGDNIYNTYNYSNKTNIIDLINSNMTNMNTTMKLLSLFGHGKYQYVVDKNGISNIISPIRTGTHFNWTDVYTSVTNAGHQFCSFIRDNWACSGERYTEKLKNTTIYNNKYILSNMNNNTFILAEGNSYVAEIIYNMLCESSNIDLWRIDTIKTDSIYAEVRGNDTHSMNIKLLLLDNHGHFNLHQDRIYNILSALLIKPTVIVIGHFNGKHGTPGDERSEYYKSIYPDAVQIRIDSRMNVLQDCSCQAQFNDCEAKKCGHQCLPGPMIPQVENIVNSIIEASYNKYNIIV